MKKIEKKSRKKADISHVHKGPKRWWRAFLFFLSFLSILHRRSSLSLSLSFSFSSPSSLYDITRLSNHHWYMRRMNRFTIKEANNHLAVFTDDTRWYIEDWYLNKLGLKYFIKIYFHANHLKKCLLKNGNSYPIQEVEKKAVR